MPQTPDDLKATVEAIQARFQPELDQLKADGAALERDAPDPGPVGGAVNMDVDVKWTDKEVVFDVPQFAMREKRLVLDLPTIIASRQTISFDTPSVRMEDKTVGYYPEWHGPLRMTMSPIITKMPETFMQRQEIVFDLPSVRMDRKEIVLSLPEVTMGRVKWVLRLPEFTVKKLSVEVEALQQRGEALRARGEDLAGRMKGEIDAAVVAFQAQFLNGLTSTREEVGAAFGSAIQAVTSAVTELQTKGVDPIKVPTADGDVNLRKSLDSLITDRDHTLGTIDADVATATPPGAAAGP